MLFVIGFLPMILMIIFIFDHFSDMVKAMKMLV